MTTKDADIWLSSKYKKPDFVTEKNFCNAKYNNINLNQSSNHSNKSQIQSKGISVDKKLSNYKNHGINQLKANHYSKENSDKNLISFKNQFEKNDYQKQLQDNKSIGNNSTLSLHIAAYENLIETNNSFNDKDLKDKSDKSNLKLENAKQIINNSKTSMINNLFVFPRQQQQNDFTDPKVAQFKASQQLLNPNATIASKNDVNQIDNTRRFPGYNVLVSFL
uniref:Uncharacterized protein n=1 Tax=Panagrolaimus sp. PS1159 TaxID=55785 RepID=A0AC35F891_9BILA